MRRLILIALAWCAIAAPAIAQLDKPPAPSSLLSAAQTVPQRWGFSSPLNRLARLERRYGADNLRINPPMSIPAYSSSQYFYLPGEIVTNNGLTFVQLQGPYCVPNGTTAPTTQTAGNSFVYDGAGGSNPQCAWASTTQATAGVAPVITPARVWFNTAQTWLAGDAMINFSGTTGYVYTTAAPCTSANSGSGPTGTSPGADGTCTWTWKYTLPTAIYSNAAAASYLWASGSGAGVGLLTNYVAVYGGVATNSSGTGYMQINQHVGNGGLNTNMTQMAAIEFNTDAAIFIIRSSEKVRQVGSAGAAPSTNAWDYIVCNSDGSGCQRASTVHTSGPGGWTYTVFDFSAAGGHKMRRIYARDLGQGTIGGIDVAATDTVTQPLNVPSLYVGIFGDSYPASGGDMDFYNAFPGVLMDLFGVRYQEQQAAGGCGYDAGTGSCGSALSRLPGVQAINGGAGPDLLVLANGTNDITTGLTPSQIAAEAAAFVQALHTPGTSTAHTLVLMTGIYAHNLGGTACTSCVNTEAAIQAAIAALNDPLVIYCNWTNAAPAWETGTGYVHSVAGNGNSDFFFNGSGASPYNNGHPNAAGQLQYAQRLKACLMQTLVAGAY